MKRIIFGVMRLVAAAGGAIFLMFALAAGLLVFCHYHGGTLTLDHHGPYWRYSRVAVGCGAGSGLWWLMYRRLSRPVQNKPQKAEAHAASPPRGMSFGLLTTTSL